jgi:hypothetical protein
MFFRKPECIPTSAETKCLFFGDTACSKQGVYAVVSVHFWINQGVVFYAANVQIVASDASTKAACANTNGTGFWQGCSAAAGDGSSGKISIPLSQFPLLSGSFDDSQSASQFRTNSTGTLTLSLSGNPLP